MEKIDNIVQAIIYIKTNPAYFDKAILELRVMPEITKLYTTTGEYLLISQVIASNNTQLHDIIQSL